MPDFTQSLQSRAAMDSKPLQGLRLGVVQQMLGPGTAPSVAAGLQVALQHLESLGASLQEVLLHSLLVLAADLCARLSCFI